MKTMYSIGWNPGRGSYCSRCFDTPEEREQFKRLIYCYREIDKQRRAEKRAAQLRTA